MNVFETETITKRFDRKTGKVKHRTIRREIAFPSTVEEITFRMWCDYFQKKEEDPAWVGELEKLPADEQLEKMALWGDKEWADYYLLILGYLQCFTNADLKTLADAPLNGEAGNGLIGVYLMLIGLINNYEPKPAETFEYKGDTYVIDKVETDRFGRTHYGKNLTVNQVIDGFQYEHVFSVKSSEGAYLIKDRKYQIDIALIAVLSKKVLPDGSFDERPLDFAEREAWTEKKILHFMDAPMTIALDVAVFFFDSRKN